MAQDMMIYWGSGSGPCWTAMMALEEKGLQGYSQKMISFSDKGHKSDEIMKLNPRGQVPTFRHGDIVVCESAAICDYLESVFQSQGTRLIPDEPAKKALVLQRKAEAPNIQKIGTEQLVYYLMMTKKEDLKEEMVKEKKDAYRKELANWEGYLKQESGNGGHICGNMSLADAAFFPILAFHVRMGLNLGERPNLQAYYNLMKDRPSVKATWPPHWVGTEGKDILADI